MVQRQHAAHHCGAPKPFHTAARGTKRWREAGTKKQGAAARAAAPIRPDREAGYRLPLKSSRFGVPLGLLLMTLPVELLMIQLWTVELDASP